MPKPEDFILDWTEPEYVTLSVLEDYTEDVIESDHSDDSDDKGKEKDAKNKKKMREGILAKVKMKVMQKADQRNSNGRVYPLDILTRETRKLKAKAGKRASYMGADHPGFRDDYRIGFDNAAAILIENDIDESTGVVSGAAEIMDTEKGKLIHKIAKAGGQIGVSSRGYGMSKEGDFTGIHGTLKNVRVIQDPFKLEGYDFVLDPSVNGAGVSSVSEGKTTDGGSPMNMETLKKDYPEVYEAILRIGEEAAVKVAEAEMNAKLETLKKEWREQAISEQGDLVTAKSLSDLKESTDKAISEKDAKVKELTEECGKLKAKIEQHEKEKNVAEAKAAVADKLANHPHRAVIEGHLSEDDLSTAEKAIAAVDKQLEYLSKFNIPGPPNTPPNENDGGQGNTKPEDPPVTATESVLRLKSMAGIN